MTNKTHTRVLTRTRSGTISIAAHSLMSILLLLSFDPAWAASSTLIPTADAYVQAGNKNATKNFGTATSLNVGTSGALAKNYDSYLKFDTTSAPDITTAKLRLYAALSKSGSSIASTAYSVADTAWSETALTWNNKPALGTALGTITVASTTYGWYEVDVTAYVQSEFAAGRKVVSFAYHNSANSTPYITAHSKEGVKKPQLIIAYNVAPTVSLTAPAANSTFNAPANITLSANASDSDGNVSTVEFYDGLTLLATLTAAPYETVWSSAPLGTHQIIARATDNQGISTSVAVNIIVAVPVQKALLYIETDHLNTPRQLTDDTGRVVWRWGGTEAFGANLPDEDPDGDGTAIVFNLRMPGQYVDKETGLHYNYFRDYDPATGRYISSDPIGLAGGLNTYGYVGGNPISRVDPDGRLAIIVPFIPAIVDVVGAGIGIGGAAGLCSILSICSGAADDPVVYPENPDNTRSKFPPIKGAKGKNGRQCTDDGSVWERDHANHGGRDGDGSQWKRWPDKRSWEKGGPSNSIWPDGRIRK